MSSPLFPDDVPVDPRLHSWTDRPSSEVTRRLGAEAIAPDAANLQAAMVQIYRQHGPQTDAEMADRLAVQRSTVNGRRGTLTKLGIVSAQPFGVRANGQSGVLNSTWGLREAQE